MITLGGTLYDSSGTAWTGSVKIVPRSTPAVVSGSVHVGKIWSFRTEAGAFPTESPGPITLVNGRYKVILGNGETFDITVAGQSGTVNIADLTSDMELIVGTVATAQIRRANTAADMLALTSSAAIQLVALVAEEDAGYARIYNFVFGDETAADGYAILRPDDDGGAYYEFIR